MATVRTMSRATVLVLLFMAAPLFAQLPTHRSTPADPAVTLPAATAGPAAGKTDPRLEVVALLYGPMPAGVAVSKAGRMFVTFPRWGTPTAFNVGELLPDKSLAPFPDPLKVAKKSDRSTAAQGICIDADDTLWLLDMDPPCLRAYDLATDKPSKTIPLPPDVTKGAYLNDFRVDPGRKPGGLAYISDSVGGAVIVVDLATGQARRRLAGHPSLRAAPDFTATVEGKAHPGLKGNVDGIAVSPDGSTLYYSAFGRRDVYAVPTDALANFSSSEADLAKSVRKLADKPSANDGMTTDQVGRIYTTDYEDSAVRVLDPRDPSPSANVLVQDARIVWPDAVWAYGDYLYITTNQLNRLPSHQNGRDLRVQPYGLFRYPLPSR